MRDRDARLADFSRGERRVRVVAVLRRQIERDRKSALPLLEVAPEPLIRLAGIAEARVGPDDPGIALSLRAAFL
jgi:hypothetical protein